MIATTFETHLTTSNCPQCNALFNLGLNREGFWISASNGQFRAARVGSRSGGGEVRPNRGQPVLTPYAVTNLGYRMRA